MYINHEQFNCQRCPWGRHCDDDYQWPDSKGPAATERFEIADSRGRPLYRSRICWLPMITAQSRFLIELYQAYRDRVLPHAGGLLDQPNYYAEAMRVIAAAEASARKHG